MTGTRQVTELQSHRVLVVSLFTLTSGCLLSAASELPSKVTDLLLGSREADLTEHLRDFL